MGSVQGSEGWRVRPEVGMELVHATSLLAWPQNIACAKRHVLDASHQDLTYIFPEQILQTVRGTFTTAPKLGGAMVARALIVGHPQTLSLTLDYQHHSTTSRNKTSGRETLPHANNPTEAYKFSAQNAAKPHRISEAYYISTYLAMSLCFHFS